MKKKKYLILAVMLVILCFNSDFLNALDILEKDNVSLGLARTIGNPKAPIQIVEFLDYQCPPCALGSEYIKEMMKKHPNLIKVEMRFHPLPSHRHAYIASRYAGCAAKQGKFWNFHNYVIERQKNWTRLSDAKPAFEYVAKDVKLDMQELSVCLEGDFADKIIKNDKKQANALGVNGTPTYFINNIKVVGLPPLKNKLKKLLNKENKTK